jgi:hypothetical protein
VNSVNIPSLPVLIRHLREDADGSMNGTGVKIMSGSWIELIMDDYAAFDRKCSNVPRIEKKRLRYFVQLLDAVRGDKQEKLRAVAHSIALLDSSPSPAIQDEIAANPMVFLQDELTVRSGASLVLWQERNGKLSPGLFCRDMLNALHTLTLIYVGSGKASKTGECSVCGKFIARERGDRRKTCSDLCRKRASLRNQRIAAQKKSQ